jgi:hypothetical protein
MRCGRLRERLLELAEEAREAGDVHLDRELSGAAHQVWMAMQLLSRVEAVRARSVSRTAE